MDPTNPSGLHGKDRSMKITCPQCDAVLTLADELEGKKVRCKRCQEILVAEVPEAAEEPEPEPVPRPKAARTGKRKLRSRRSPGRSRREVFWFCIALFT